MLWSLCNVIQILLEAVDISNYRRDQRVINTDDHSKPFHPIRYFSSLDANFCPQEDDQLMAKNAILLTFLLIKNRP
jgi:hypothetical protein